MKRPVVLASFALLAHCSGEDRRPPASPDGGAGSGGTGTSGSGATSGKASGGAGGTSPGVGGSGNRPGGGGTIGGGGGSGNAPGQGGTQPNGTGGQRPYPDAHDPNDSPPIIGGPGCGFGTAAFCDTFGAPATIKGRGGELDGIFWSAGRMHSQGNSSRPMGIGMAVIPECRPGLAGKVFPPNDVLVCDPVQDVKSHHLLLATAAQNYGHNGFRIKQPFDFAGRTGKITFDASCDPFGPIFGWMSVAVTEDPISMPGYAIRGNDEGSIIPKNAIEVHFANAGGDAEMIVRHVHVFRNYADTAYEAPNTTPHATRKWGKLNRYEVLLSQTSIEVRVTPYSEDGTTFAAATLVHKQAIDLPFSRGFVHLGLHNHATLKYTQPDANPQWGIIDAPVARVDNVGFDGPVITNWREYEVPDSLVKFNEPNPDIPPDPHNGDNTGYDVGYFVGNDPNAPRHTHQIKNVDLSRVTRARLAVGLWTDLLSRQGNIADYTLRARLNGKAWRDRRLNAEEAKFVAPPGPTVVDGNGAKVGDPNTQGRLALLIDVPLEDLVAGDNTVEFVGANLPMAHPPIVANVDLVLTLD